MKLFFQNNSVILLVSCFVTSSLIYSLSSFADYVVIPVIVFGQAHFFTAYFYTYRAKKMDKSYFVKFLTYFIPSLIISFFVYYNNNYLTNLFFWTYMLFVFHYAIDELKMNNIQFLKMKPLLALLITLSFFSVTYVKDFGYDKNILMAVFLLSIPCFFIFFYKNLRLILDNHKNNILPYIFVLLNIFLPWYLIYSEYFTIVQITSFIILLHYVRWYFHYYIRFDQKEDKYERNFYLKISLCLNLFMVALFAIHYVNQEYTYLIYLFGPSFFYGWTIIHILLSLRSQDLKLNFYE